MKFSKEEILKILEGAKDEQGSIPFNIVKKAIEKLIVEPEWIPCSERPPEEKKLVLVTCEDMYLRKLNPCVGWRNENYHWFTFTANGCKQILYPVAWMPRPPRYKGDKT